MLNITHYQRNTNQNHNEVPLHAIRDGCYPKVIILYQILDTDILMVENEDWVKYVIYMV